MKNMKFLKMGVVVIPLLIVIGISTYLSMAIVREGEVGVLARFGEGQRVLQPGLNWHNFITHDVVMLSSRVESLDIDFSAHSIDAQPMRAGITVHYSILPQNAISIVADFGDMDRLYRRLSPIFLAETQIVLATKTAMEMIENRGVLATEIHHALQMIAPQYHIRIDNVILEELIFSEEFNRAVENRIRAEQETMMAVIEQERAIIQAEQYLEVQRLRNQVIIDQAQADADALYIMQNAWGDLAGEVRDAMLRQMFFETWDGVLPSVMGSGDSIGLILDGFQGN